MILYFLLGFMAGIIVTIGFIIGFAVQSQKERVKHDADASHPG